jgi:hypothetical protein
LGTNLTSDRLNTYAKMHGGYRTYDFSQSTAFKVAEDTDGDQGKMYKMVLRNGKPMGGLCKTICAFWIAFHAQQDLGTSSFTKGRSVWDYLFNNGGLNLGSATNITVEHHQSSGNQNKYFETFLKKFKIVRRKKSITGAPLNESGMPLTFTSLLGCAKNITQAGGYTMIGLSAKADGTGGGHAVSGWYDGSDVLFMDPNFGEFWLPSRAAFLAWFQFYIMNTYGRKYKGLYVHTYVPG